MRIVQHTQVNITCKATKFSPLLLMEIEFHRKQPIQRHDSANRRSGLRKNISAIKY